MKKYRDRQYALSAPALIILVCLLQACAPQPRIRPEPPLAQQAHALEDAGEYRQAASTWQQLAQLSPEPHTYLLAAAENWARYNDWTTTSQLLETLDISHFDHHELQRYHLLQAEAALTAGRYDLAQQALQQLPETPDAALDARHNAVLSALTQLSQGPAAIHLHDLMQAYLSPLLDPGEAFIALARQSTVNLQQLRLLRTDPVEQAWLDLAVVARNTTLQPQTTGDALRFWWNSHLQAGPGPQLAAESVSRFHRTYRYPRRIAVLLPFDSSLKSAARAIRDGLLTAWAELSAEQRPELRFIPLNDDPASAIGALIEAQEQECDWVIGPLQRDAVNASLQFTGNTLPLLLLNRPDAEAVSPPGLPVYSFALLPEDDARASAQMALDNGHRRALVLSSDDAWGERVAQAFSEHFSAAGGQVLQRDRFDTSSANHSPQLRSLLSLNEAQARYNRLRGLLRLPLGFEATPRQDADMIFLGARVTQARQLRPQLRFFDAGHIPVFATSQIYTGRDDRRNDRDLNGVQLPLAPWLLNRGGISPSRQQSSRWFSNIEALSSAQLYALGLDVIRLLPYLQFLQSDSYARITGAHGQLQVNPDGHVIRELSPAQFYNSAIRLQPEAAPLVTGSESGAR